MRDYATDEEEDLLDFAEAHGACAEVVDLRIPIAPVCTLLPPCFLSPPSLLVPRVWGITALSILTQYCAMGEFIERSRIGRKPPVYFLY